MILTACGGGGGSGGADTSSGTTDTIDRTGTSESSESNETTSSTQTGGTTDTTGTADTADTTSTTDTSTTDTSTTDTSTTDTSTTDTSDTSDTTGTTSTSETQTLLGELPQDCELSAEDMEMLTLVNQARADGHDCGAAGYFSATHSLNWDCRPETAAQRHSDDMASGQFLSHVGSDGSTMDIRVTDALYSWRALGENIAFGQSSVERVVQAWLASDGHCRNIMNPAYYDFGAAWTADTDGALYWTQVFAAPQS